MTFERTRDLCERTFAFRPRARSRSPRDHSVDFAQDRWILPFRVSFEREVHADEGVPPKDRESPRRTHLLTRGAT